MSNGFYKFFVIIALALASSVWLTAAYAAPDHSDLTATSVDSGLLLGADGFNDTVLGSAAEMVERSPQQGLPSFACDGTVYHIRDRNIYTIDVSSDAPVLGGPIFVYHENINSLGFNPLDNYLYMVTKSADLLRVGQYGTYENLGRISGIDRSYFVGDFLPDGTYILGNGSTLFLVDISRMTVIKTISVKLRGKGASFSDIAVHPINSKVYAKDQKTNELITVNLDTGVATPIGPSFPGNSGSVWFDENGTFYGHSFTGSGDFYRVDADTGAHEWLGNGSKPTAHDATSCSYSFGFELELDSSIACEASAAQQLRMINRTSQTLSGLRFTQTLPAGFSFADTASTIQSDWRSSFGNSVSVSISGQTITATDLQVGLSDTDFELNITRDDTATPATATFRADVDNLPSTYGSSVTSDDPSTPPEPDDTEAILGPCPPDIPNNNAACSAGYTQLDRYNDIVNTDQSYSGSFSVARGTNIRIEGYIAEGHPELGCDLGASGSHSDCSQTQDSENMDIIFDGSIISSYRDGEGAYGWQNFYFPFGPVDQVTATGDFTVEFEHPGPIRSHSLTTDLVVCAASDGVLTSDFGDAPASYGDAETVVVDGLYLGGSVDMESPAHFSADAAGDDNNRTDDEDGIRFVSGTDLMVGATGYEVIATMVNETSSAGILQGWIDFDMDGQFDHLTERIGTYTLAGLQSGPQSASFTFDVPNVPDACGMSTYARFRFTSGSSVTPTETHTGGETEDYQINFVCGSINGYIWEDADNYGYLDTGEEFMGGTVTLYDSAGTLLELLNVPNSGLDRGQYAFSGLPADTYRVEVTGVSGYQPTFDADGVLDDKTDVTLNAGRRNVTANFGYREATADVVGTIWYDADADGVNETLAATPPTGEHSLAGVTVKLISLLGVEETTTTDSGGRYAFTDVAAGLYRVEIEAGPNPALDDYQLTYDADGTLDGVTFFESTLGGTLEISVTDLFSAVPEAPWTTLGVPDFSQVASDSRRGVSAKPAQQLPSTIDFGYVNGDLSVEIISVPTDLMLEEDVTWEIRVGSVTEAENVEVEVTPPASLVSLLATSESSNLPGYSFTADAGWSCSYDTAVDTLGCSWSGIYPATVLTDSEVIRLTMRVPGTFVGDSFTAAATVTSTVTYDENTANNRDEAVTTVARSWTSADFSGQLGFFTHVQYDPVLGLTVREQDSNETILNPLQVPISVTFGLSTTAQPMLTVTYCDEDVSGDLDCTINNGDAYITGTMVVRSYTITGLMHTEDDVNLITTPITVVLGTDRVGKSEFDGRAVGRDRAACDSYTVDCLLPYVESEPIVSSLAITESNLAPQYEWQDYEYLVINLFTNGGRDIDVSATHKVEEDNAKPGLYQISGFVSVEIVYSDYRLDSDYVAPFVIPVTTYLRIIAPFVEPEPEPEP